MKKTINQVIKTIEKAKSELEFIPTGFRNLDTILDGGFLRKELIVLGGFTGSGKSFFCGQIFLNVMKKGFKCLYFSLEISNETVISRLLGGLADINPTRIRAGWLTEDEQKRKIEAKTELASLNGFGGLYDEMYKLDDIEREIKKEAPDFVVIDFIQNIFADGDEYAKLSAISLKLQELAKSQNCAILVASQLSNSFAKEGVEAKNIQYKGSGNIAMVADMGFIIDRAENSKITLGLQKNRRGVSRTQFEFGVKEKGGLIYEL